MTTDISLRSSPFPTAAVIGCPIIHSLSPRLHSYWLNKHGLKGAYTRQEVTPEHLAHFMRNLPHSGLRGINVTVPHKETIIPFLHRLDPLAARVGAVNTVIVNTDGHMTGYNTDVFGFSENLRMAGCAFRGKKVCLLGAGGAARAAIVAFQQENVASLCLVNRTQEKAEKLAAEFSSPDYPAITVYSASDPTSLIDADIVVNATSGGLTGELTFDLSRLSPHAVVTDMVYKPLITPFLDHARARGCTIVDGLGMLLYQAVPAFQSFFGASVTVTDDLRNHMLEGMTGC